MAQDRHRLVEELFHAALENGDRYLETACAGDEALKNELLGLLESYRQWSAGTPVAAYGEAAGRRFGAFEAIDVLGRGGASVVYLARRVDGQFDQLAAVKVIHPGLLTASYQESFLQERRILAGLRHPGITQVLDGGIQPGDGSPYLVMEYIDGQRIDAFCQNHRLGIRARLKLFLAACDAVSYAHRNLVAHLDLKPSNMLVTADGRPKLLDFGTAKLLAAADSLATQKFVTPRYGSPEQLRGERAGLLSDVYSLGIVLAEVLCGRWPFEGPDSQLTHLRRAVNETAPLPLAEAATGEHAQECGVSLKQLRGALRGDLTSIVARALEGNAERRYRSVDEFSADVGRYLDGRPVTAGPSSRLYRTRRFVSRNRVAVAASATAAILVALAGGYALEEQRRSAEEGRRAQKLNKYMMRLFQFANPPYGGRVGMTVGELADRALLQAGAMLADQPASRAELGLILAGHRVFTHGLAAAAQTATQSVDAARAAGDMGLVASVTAYRGYLRGNLGECAGAIADANEAQILLDRYAGGVTAERRSTALLNVSSVLWTCARDGKRALAAVDEALRFAMNLPNDSLEVSSPPAALKVYGYGLRAAVLGCQQGQASAMEGLALARRAELPGLEGATLAWQAECLHASGHPAEGAAALEKAIARFDTAYSASFPLSISLRAARAVMLLDAGEAGRQAETTAEAIQALEDSQCDRLPAVCTAAKAYAAQVLTAQGRFRDVEPLMAGWLGRPDLAPVAKACLFVHWVDARQFGKAAPYRDAAAAWAGQWPSTSAWRRRLQAALAAQP